MAGRSGRRRSGAQQIGGCVYELADGERTYPYHFHHGMEEWLVVLSGSPTLRDPDGERVLRPGDVVCFPVGPEGGHQVTRPRLGADPLGVARAGVDRVPGQRQGRRVAAGEDLPAGRRDRLLGGRVSDGDVNLFDAPRAADEGDPPGTRCRTPGIGPLIGASALGMTVYELNEGNSICPYHYEYPDEEWLIVLEGTPTLRDPEGEHDLAPGDVVCFPTGPDGAHKVTNREPGRALVAMLSTKAETVRRRLPRQRQGRRLHRRHEAAPPQIRRGRLLARRTLTCPQGPRPGTVPRQRPCRPWLGTVPRRRL